MKRIDTIYEKDFHEVNEPESRDDYYHRRAARAVLLDAEGKVFLIHVALHGYHKLPGGGIKEGEEIEQALARELMEEVGCEAEILSEIGEIVEYREYEKMVQTSYCFIARQVGDKVSNSMEEDELSKGMTEIKADSINHAVQLLKADSPKDIGEEFMHRRDLGFLKEAQRLLA